MSSNKKEYMRKWKSEHKERVEELNKASYLRHRDEILVRGREHYAKNKEEMRNYINRWNYQLKLEVLTHYSKGDKPECVICGESRLPCLSLDHIDEVRGSEDRKRGRSGHTLYSHLKKLGFPDGYRTLCMNCQFIRKHSKFETGKIYNH